MIEKKKIIAVIGGSKSSAKESKLAEEVGREVAKRGAILICGGLGGIMEAACRGANSEGGLTIGVLPGENSREANEYVQISIITGIGYARNVVVVKSAQAVIAISGSYGTLTEIGYALQNGIPVIGLDTWSISRKGKADRSIILAENAADALSIAFDHITD